MTTKGEGAGPAGYSGTPLARKLGISDGMRVRLVDPPEGYWRLIDPAGDGGEGGLPGDRYRLDATPADFQHLFATRRDDLERALADARRHMTPNGTVWVSWPKKSSGVASEIGRDEVMEEGKAAGLVDVKVCAVDETWSGLKWVIPKADR